MAPVEKRFMISAAGSTSSIGIGPPGAPATRRSRPRSVASLLGLVVDRRGVLLEDLVALGPRGVLELEDGPRVEEVVLALPAPLVLATHLELAVGPLGRPVEVGQAVAGGHLGGQHVEPDPADAAGRAGEVLVDHRVVEADGLEDLGAGVGGHRRDAHLGHHLQDALAGRLDVVLVGLAGRDRRRAGPPAIMSSIVSRAR